MIDGKTITSFPFEKKCTKFHRKRTKFRGKCTKLKLKNVNVNNNYAFISSTNTELQQKIAILSLKCYIFAIPNEFQAMTTTSFHRKQTSFRLGEDLLTRLQAEAKRHNRSLNNLVESVLMAFVSERPNKTTRAAMHEAETSENLETLDLNNFRSFVDSL